MTNPPFKISDYDPQLVDELAAEWVCAGDWRLGHRLDPHTKVAVVLRLYGKRRAEDIAALVGVSERQVWRYAELLKVAS